MKMTFIMLLLASAPALGWAQAEEEIVLPEGMETDLSTDYNAQHLLTTPTQEATDASDFTAEDYARRLAHLPCVIPMPYNDVVRKYIDQYTGRLRRSVSLMLGAQNFYMPIFEDALEAEGLPLELRYLPIIESALKPTATIRVRAVGLWKLILSTGKQYGLEVTSLVDERRDPLKSTAAAARYLKALYSEFGDWTLVIAAYNCGPTNVEKAIKRAGGAKDYWQINPYLPRETQGYVPAFIAANYVMTYYCLHGIAPAEAELPEATDTIMLNRNLRMEQVEDLCGVKMDLLKALNPQYRTTLIPAEARPQAIRLPLTAVDTFLELGDSIYNHRAEELVTPREVEVATAPTPSASKGKAKSNASYATVRKGDTLGAIAKRNRTTVGQIQRLNGLRGNTIRPGQKLRVR